jgi:peptidoglycan/xylan/chitin deacetylase (PgdA/CDA1 family)
MTSSFKALVVCYHAISDRWEHALAIRQKVVERQLADLLARGYRPVSAEQVISGRAGFLHITFDDAYRSIVALLPTLQRLGIPATIFVSSDYADEGRALAVPELAAEAAAQPAELETLDWSGLRDVAQRGLAIGSHTLSHAHLTRLSDAELKRELRESRERVADEIRRPCRFFAYPYGEHDSRVRSAVKAAGYEAAFALHRSARPFDPYSVPRVGLYRRDGRLRSRLKLSAMSRGIGVRRAR